MRDGTAIAPLLQILRHDGAGGLSFEDRPYIVMNDHAQVDLGEVR